MDLKGIVLIGPYNAGKTSCSKVISASCGWNRFDLDEIYTERFGETIWATREISRKSSDERRDLIGYEIIQEIKKPSNSIVVFGGGSFFLAHPESVDEIKKSHLFVYLHPSRETLIQRAMNDTSSGTDQFLFKDADRIAIDRYLEQLMLKRGQDYLKWADRVVEPKISSSVKEVAYEILSCFLFKKTYK
jgi:shikimate kinase